MIQVRDVFHLQFGKAREAIELARRAVEMEKKFGAGEARLLTDLTGDFYTLVLESEHESLAAYEESYKRAMESGDFREWYPRFAALVRDGRREIYNVVDVPAEPRIDSSVVGERVVGA